MKQTAFFTLLTLMLSSSLAFAQKKGSTGGSGAGYGTGIGLRGGGYSSGLTIKHFLSGKKGVAVEGLVTREYKSRGARFTVLLEKHHPIKEVKGLQFYYGAGAHVGFYQSRYYFADARRKYAYYDYYYSDRVFITPGADLVLGLEYKMEDLPFVLGIDYKPYFEVFDGYTGFYNDAALSLRFTL